MRIFSTIMPFTEKCVEGRLIFNRIQNSLERDSGEFVEVKLFVKAFVLIFVVVRAYEAKKKKVDEINAIGENVFYKKTKTLFGAEPFRINGANWPAIFDCNFRVI